MTVSIHHIPKILFFDVETVRSYPEYQSMPAAMRTHWERKCRNKYWQLESDDNESDQFSEWYIKKAGIFAEFARIACISAGIVSVRGNEIDQIRIKSFSGNDESEILRQFNRLLDSHFPNPNSHFLCGHNIREFDVPFLCRRLLINQMKFPAILDISGKKPWQTPQIIDTLEMWKFGDYKNYTSLDLLCTLFEIPSPKQEMDGSMVSDVFWDENNLPKIARYCENDVISVVRLFLKFNHLNTIEDEKLIRVDAE